MDATVGALVTQLNGELIGDPDHCVSELMPLAKAGSAALSFVADDTPIRQLEQSAAGTVLISMSRLADLTDNHKADSNFILVEDAMASFLTLVQADQPPRVRPEFGVSPQATVAETATIGDRTNIHPGAVIGEAVVIGENCDIHSGVVIGDHCQIGADCTIYPNTVLYAHCVLQDRVIIHANAVIGADGFGYRFIAGAFNKIEHFGSVLLENDVEIGAGSTVDRGMIGPTILREGTKIDNLVMIAHNCEIGRHNAFASQVGVAGSSSTGDYVRCGGQAGLADHVHVGEGSSVGAMAGVTRDLPAGDAYLGAPARRAELTHKILMAQTKLPEMRVKLRELTKQVAKLESQIEQLNNKEELNDAA
jgi:UDP-3-O-[3-hydroxymyristoyl] glucosamine N-acyltransferase